ncbi:hypothetical protein [Allorhizocola rhizosphaerae]|uniref:hypothetical protein n=1 Tax=Allorhizocola rhizosphaerae TaxID=1872709 RepID=UPI0013C36E36|nr:hypothetical protein [Allorhizocola rhizosphaerae]
MLVIGFDYQRGAIGETGGYRFVGIGDPQAESVVAERIAKLVQEQAEAGSEPVVLYSFHPLVLALCDNLAGQGHSVSGRNLTEFSRSKAAVDTKATSRWPADFMQIDEALAVLVTVLQEKGHVGRDKPVFKTEIRKLLQRADIRFDKNHSKASGSQNLISELVNQAAARGLIDVAGKEPRIVLWLREPKSVQAEIGEERTPSQEYVNILMSSGLGPFADFRTQLYDMIELTVHDNAGKLGRTELVKRAVAGVREQAPDLLLRPRRKPIPRDSYPWNKLRVFAGELLEKVPVLLNEAGQPFCASWGTAFDKVHGLTEDWRNQLESFLVLELVRKGAVIRSGQAEDLAGALFANRSEESVVRVEEILQPLFEKGRLRFDPDTDTLCLA